MGSGKIVVEIVFLSSYFLSRGSGSPTQSRGKYPCEQSHLLWNQKQVRNNYSKIEITFYHVPDASTTTILDICLELLVNMEEFIRSKSNNQFLMRMKQHQNQNLFPYQFDMDD